MKISKSSGLVFGVAVLAALVVIVDGGDQSSELSSQMTIETPPATGLTGDALEALPFDDLSDWRSYAEQVSVVRIASERGTPDPAQAGQPNRYIIRAVTATVEETLWSRSDPVDSITFETWGWQTRNGKRVALNTEDGPRLEIGRRYVIAFTRSDGEWSAQTSSSVLPLNGDVIAAGATAATAPAAQALVGLSVKQLKERLAATPPNPVAAKHSRLPPVSRFRMVQKVAAQR